MIKVLICEDEKPLARALAKLVNEHDKYTVSHIAHNGKEGMTFLQSNEVDVAFLDINMPIMSGLDILKEIEDTLVVPVMVTSYEDFNFARDALRYGAFDYLLKPIEKQQIHDVLERIYKEKFHTKAENDNIIDFKALSHIQSCFFGLVYIGGVLDTYLEPEVQAVIDKTETLLRKDFSKHFTEKEILFTKGRSANERYVIISHSVTQYKKVLKDMFFDIKYQVPVSMLFSNDIVIGSDIPGKCKNFESLLQEHVFFEENALFFENCLEHSPVIFSENAFVEVTAKMPKGRAEKLLGELITTVRKRKDMKYIVKKFFLLLCEKSSVDVDYLTIEPEIIYAIDNSFSTPELIVKLLILFDTYFFANTEAHLCKTTIAKAMKDYMDRNYRQEISSAKLEEVIGYTQFYLRKVFKEEYSMSPNTYLTKLRVDKACVLLEKNLSVKDVALEVGYNDALYFSKLFKKQMGYAPSEYRQHNSVLN